MLRVEIHIFKSGQRFPLSRFKSKDFQVRTMAFGGKVNLIAVTQRCQRDAKQKNKYRPYIELIGHVAPVNEK